MFYTAHPKNYQLTEIKPSSYHRFGLPSFTHSPSLVSGEAVGLPSQNWGIPPLKMSYGGYLILVALTTYKYECAR